MLIINVGLPEPLAALEGRPECVDAVLLGVAHRVRALAAVDDKEDREDDRIEVTTACGLTDITENWRDRNPEFPTVSYQWHRAERMYGLPPACPRCNPTDKKD